MTCMLAVTKPQMIQEPQLSEKLLAALLTIELHFQIEMLTSFMFPGHVLTVEYGIAVCTFEWLLSSVSSYMPDQARFAIKNLTTI